MQAKEDRSDASGTRFPRLTWRGMAGIIWALPLSLFGLLLALPVMCFGGRMSLVPALRVTVGHGQMPAVLVRGRVADVMLARHPYGAMQAMAIGHVIIADRAAVSRRLLVHELVHVAQAARWGVLFPLVYLGASLRAKRAGGNAYWDNVFEVEARRAEQHA
jgi:hypothetical protein